MCGSKCIYRPDLILRRGSPKKTNHLFHGSTHACICGHGYTWRAFRCLEYIPVFFLTFAYIPLVVTYIYIVKNKVFVSKGKNIYTPVLQPNGDFASFFKLCAFTPAMLIFGQSDNSAHALLHIFVYYDN